MFCIYLQAPLLLILVTLHSLPGSSQYAGQINEALSQQGLRMDRAAAEEKKRKALALESRKRPSSTSFEPVESKRVKLEAEATQSSSVLSKFDFTSLPAPLITNLIVANLEAFTEPELISMVNTYRQSRGLSSSVVTITPPEALFEASKVHSTEPPISVLPRSTPTAEMVDGTLQAQDTEPLVKHEPLDPLKMDIDEEELEYEPEKLNEAVSLITISRID